MFERLEILRCDGPSAHRSLSLAPFLLYFAPGVFVKHPKSLLGKDTGKTPVQPRASFAPGVFECACMISLSIGDGADAASCRPLELVGSVRAKYE